MNQQFYRNMALWVVILVMVLLLITMLAWVIGCGCFYRWQIFPTMGYFMCTTFLVWAARQVLGDYFPAFA